MDDFHISTERGRMDVELIHRFLSEESYWARGRGRDVVERSLDNSLCFGAFVRDEQIGFGRLVTDRAVIGYIADMFVVRGFRGRGIGKALVKAIVEHPDVASLQVLLLRTTDARTLYTQFGFGPVPKPEELLGKYQPVARAQNETEQAHDRRSR